MKEPMRSPEVMKATVSNQDKDLMRMRATKAAAEEMGENADELEMLKRVEELTDKLLREKFPEAYTPAPKKKRAKDSTDIWENGTVVRYMARALCVLLAAGGLYAWYDPKEVKAPDRTKFIRATPAGATPRSTSNSRKTK
eukprot:g10184.t1